MASWIAEKKLHPIIAALMSLSKLLANRFVIRPTTNAIPHDVSKLARVEVSLRQGIVEAFVGNRVALNEYEFNECPGNIDSQLHPDLLVLKLPGAAGRAERSTMFPASLLGNHTSEVWTWNPPGYGRSTGPASLGNMGSTAVDFFSRVLETRRGEQTKVWISGNSLGCATGLYLATKLKVDGLVMRNPPPLVELISARDAWWNLWRGGRYVAAGVPVELDAILNAAEVIAPILFIESGADTIVPTYFQSLIRDAHPGPQKRLLLRGAAHNAAIGDEYKEEIVSDLEWLFQQ